MADWNTPSLGDTKVDVMSLFKARDVDAASLAESPTNTPTGYVRYNRSANKFQEWNGSAWVDFVLAIAGGGTGASDASGARTSLGLGTLATQNSNAISVSGGTIAGLTSLGASGNATFGGIIIAGSGAVVLTDSAGNILESAIANGTILARVGSNETITGVYTFSTNPVFNNNAIPESKINNGNVLARVNDTETITSVWTFSANPVFNDASIPESKIADIGVITRNAANEIITGSWSFPGGLVGNIAGNATTATTLQTARTINGVSFDGSANITVTAAANTLTGTTLPVGVINSNLVTLGTLVGLVLSDGSAATPVLRFASGLTAGMYYNPSNPTVEFGTSFASSTTRAVVRALGTSTPRVDFLVGGAFPIEIYENRIVPGADNTISCGATGRRFTEIWATNGVIQTSDIRHKTVHHQIDNALDFVRAIPTFVASWKYDNDDRKFPAFSAQDIHEVIDKELDTKIVVTDKYDAYSLYQERMIPVLWAAVRELDAQVQRISKV